MAFSGLSAQLWHCCAVHLTSPLMWTRYSVVICVKECWQLQLVVYMVLLARAAPLWCACVQALPKLCLSCIGALSAAPHVWAPGSPAQLLSSSAAVLLVRLIIFMQWLQAAQVAVSSVWSSAHLHTAAATASCMKDPLSAAVARSLAEPLMCVDTDCRGGSTSSPV